MTECEYCAEPLTDYNACADNSADQHVCKDCCDECREAFSEMMDIDND